MNIALINKHLFYVSLIIGMNVQGALIAMEQENNEESSTLFKKPEERKSESNVVVSSDVLDELDARVKELKRSISFEKSPEIVQSRAQSLLESVQSIKKKVDSASKEEKSLPISIVPHSQWTLFWYGCKTFVFGRSYLVSIPATALFTSFIWWSIQKIKWLKTEPALNKEALIILATRVLEVALFCYRKVPCASAIVMYFDRLKPRLTLLSVDTMEQLRKLTIEFDAAINESSELTHDERALKIAPPFHALLDYIEHVCFAEIEKKPLNLLA